MRSLQLTYSCVSLQLTYDIIMLSPSLDIVLTESCHTSNLLQSNYLVEVASTHSKPRRNFLAIFLDSLYNYTSCFT